MYIRRRWSVVVVLCFAVLGPKSLQGQNIVHLESLSVSLVST